MYCFEMTVVFFLYLCLFSSVSFAANTKISGLRQVSDLYYISTNIRNFIGAILDCEINGMELASIKNASEQDILNEILTEQENKAFYEGYGYWLGAMTLGNNYWFWVDTGSRMLYSNWGSNQPYFFQVDKFNCVQMGNYYKGSNSYTWQNVDCSLELYYICKKQ